MVRFSPSVESNGCFTGDQGQIEELVSKFKKPKWRAEASYHGDRPAHNPRTRTATEATVESANPANPTSRHQEGSDGLASVPGETIAAAIENARCHTMPNAKMMSGNVAGFRI